MLVSAIASMRNIRGHLLLLMLFLLFLMVLLLLRTGAMLPLMLLVKLLKFLHMLLLKWKLLSSLVVITRRIIAQLSQAVKRSSQQAFIVRKHFHCLHGCMYPPTLGHPHLELLTVTTTHALQGPATRFEQRRHLGMTFHRAHDDSDGTHLIEHFDIVLRGAGEVFDDPCAASLEGNVFRVVLHRVDDRAYAPHQTDGVGVLGVETVCVQLFGAYALYREGEGETTHGHDDVADVPTAIFKVGQGLFDVGAFHVVVHGVQVMVVDAGG
mmetsp:Transcript_27113/g.49235  ORF Transcript_27113/g.49235 Transcript_27113/m.49235 type:complete len:267 (+) Transcript_27113:1737-2537(+)